MSETELIRLQSRDLFFINIILLLLLFKLEVSFVWNRINKVTGAGFAFFKYYFITLIIQTISIVTIRRLVRLLFFI